MEFTFDESVHLVDAYTEVMLKDFDAPLRYQLQEALLTLTTLPITMVDDAYSRGYDHGKDEAYTEGYNDGMDA